MYLTNRSLVCSNVSICRIGGCCYYLNHSDCGNLLHNMYSMTCGLWGHDWSRHVGQRLCHKTCSLCRFGHNEWLSTHWGTWNWENYWVRYWNKLFSFWTPQIKHNDHGLKQKHSCFFQSRYVQMMYTKRVPSSVLTYIGVWENEKSQNPHRGVKILKTTTVKWLKSKIFYKNKIYKNKKKV